MTVTSVWQERLTLPQGVSRLRKYWYLNRLWKRLSVMSLHVTMHHTQPETAVVYNVSVGVAAVPRYNNDFYAVR